MKPAAAEKTLKDSLSRINMTTDLSAVKDCEIVIESVIENMDIKKDLYDKLDKILDKESILGTNTSSYSITELVGNPSPPSPNFTRLATCFVWGVQVLFDVYCVNSLHILTGPDVSPP